MILGERCVVIEFLPNGTFQVLPALSHVQIEDKAEEQEADTPGGTSWTLQTVPHQLMFNTMLKSPACQYGKTESEGSRMTQLVVSADGAPLN